MGFFDEVSKQEGEKQSLAKTEQVVKDLYHTYLAKYKRLQRTSAYSSALNEEKEKAFNNFKDYFSSRGFDIVPSQYSNAEGFNAKLGDFEAEFIYQGSNEFRFSIKGIESETLTLEDRKEKSNNFQGHVNIYNEITMGQNVLEGDRLSVYLKAAENIKKDIADIEEISESYKPNLHFYLSNKGRHVNDINEYLDLLNEQLKH